MQATLANSNATRGKRISAALGLSWRQRVDEGRPIDVPCFDLNAGAAQFAILPAESFVGYQLAAQRLRAESFVMVAGFGDGAPGCIATDQCWRDGYAERLLLGAADDRAADSGSTGRGDGKADKES